MNPGLAYTALAFVSWGLFPLYFHVIAHVAPLEVVLHRSVWTLIFVAGLLAVQHRWHWLRAAFRQPRLLAVFAVAILLLAGNWLIYVYAVQTGQVVQASLGYYINPLFSVLLGVKVLGERLRPAQWVAVALAAAGVAWLTWHAGQVPWLALVLAASFAIYGLLRKTAALGPLEGLALETLLLAPLALPLLLWWTLTHDSALAQGDPATLGWLALSGPLTAVPLLLFAAGARRLPLATVGMVQYVSPSIQLMLGVWVFGEPFDTTRLAGFVLIWTALALVSVDALRHR
jgi:chloramphenicol-sensitive protein RarD